MLNVEAASPPGWEARNNAMQRCEASLHEAMKLVEAAQQCVRDAETVIVPYMNITRHRTACNVLSYSLDSVLFEHRHVVNVLINDGSAAAPTTASTPHI